MQSKLSNLAGEEQSPDELVKQIYVELKRMARGRLHLERNGLTLNTTALVHEAWMRACRCGYSAPSLTPINRMRGRHSAPTVGSSPGHDRH